MFHDTYIVLVKTLSVISLSKTICLVMSCETAILYLVKTFELLDCDKVI